MSTIKIDSKRVYASLAVNRYSNCVDWQDQLIAIGSYNTVAIFDPEVSIIYQGLFIQLQPRGFVERLILFLFPSLYLILTCFFHYSHSE